MTEQQREKTRAACRAWRKNNPDRQREASQRWADANRDQMRAHWRARRARKKGASGTHTAADLAEIMKAQKGKCAYCRNPLAEKHVDHIQPLSKGGSDSRQNIQVLCPPCNQRKHAKDPIEFARQMGRLI